MRQSSIFFRRFGVKSNRSENPLVKINIQLTHCNSVKEVFQVINNNELIPSQKTFALRMISRIVNSRLDQVPELYSPNYMTFAKNTEGSIDKCQSLQICDVMY